MEYSSANLIAFFLHELEKARYRPIFSHGYCCGF